MTKEELEKEAEEFTDTKKSFWRQGRTCIGSVKQAYIAGAEPREKRIAELEEENAELKAKVGLSIDCEKAQKNGELCLGYGGDEDEPCEQCKNCIKCEGGYYQLGETEKDEQLTKSKEIIRELLDNCFGYNSKTVNYEVKVKAEQFLKEIEK